jgi:hypothetical protein
MRKRLLEQLKNLCLDFEASFDFLEKYEEKISWNIVDEKEIKNRLNALNLNLRREDTDIKICYSIEEFGKTIAEVLKKEKIFFGQDRNFISFLEKYNTELYQKIAIFYGISLGDFATKILWFFEQKYWAKIKGSKIVRVYQFVFEKFVERIENGELRKILFSEGLEVLYRGEITSVSLYVPRRIVRDDNLVLNQSLKFHFLDIFRDELGEKLGYYSAYNDLSYFVDLWFNGAFVVLVYPHDIVVLVQPVIEITENGRFHSEKGPAIYWQDWGMYFIEGVEFTKEEWEKVVNKTLTLEELLKFNNIEKRRVAFARMDPERVLKESKAKRLHKSKRGNELYLVEGIFSEKAYFLKYKCPSTGRIYIKGIPPEIGRKKDADLAQAWSLGLTKEEYLNELKTET